MHDAIAHDDIALDDADILDLEFIVGDEDIVEVGVARAQPLLRLVTVSRAGARRAG